VAPQGPTALGHPHVIKTIMPTYHYTTKQHRPSARPKTSGQGRGPRRLGRSSPRAEDCPSSLLPSEKFKISNPTDEPACLLSARGLPLVPPFLSGWVVSCPRHGAFDDPRPCCSYHIFVLWSVCVKRRHREADRPNPSGVSLAGETVSYPTT